MVKQLKKGGNRMRTAYWSLVGMAGAMLITLQPVMADTIWDRFSTIMKDVYGQLVGISTIVAVTAAAIALLVRMISRNQRAEIIGNADIQLMLGCTDDVSAEYFSARGGDMSIQVNSTMTVRQTIAVAQVIPQYRQTEGQGRRRLLTPDEVLRLPNEELLCIIRGCNMLKLSKLDYTKHQMSKQIVKSSVMDYHPNTAYDPMPQTEPEMAPEAAREPVKKPIRRKSLYSSAQPPTEF